MAKNWYDQMQTLAEEYMNRKPFSYDMDKDKLYQSVKDNYVKQGRQAMEDTMGQAAGLTGGYASSYGQAVGNQAYQDYLTKLNAQAPEFYDRARAAYDAEGADLMDRIGLAQQMYNTQLSAAAAAGRGSRGGGTRYVYRDNGDKDKDKTESDPETDAGLMQIPQEELNKLLAMARSRGTPAAQFALRDGFDGDKYDLQTAWEWLLRHINGYTAAPHNVAPRPYAFDVTK